MTFDPDKVDIVALSPDETAVELHIVRETPWYGDADELTWFQSKVQTYVSYAVDGQMHADYPETRNLPWAIVVSSLGGPPDEQAQHVMSVLQDNLRNYGGSLQHREGAGG